MKTIYHHEVPGNNTGRTARKDPRRMTFAGIVNPDNRTITIGVAITNPNDMYCKKRGRVIAAGRAAKKPLRVVEVPQEHRFVETFLAACQEYAAGVNRN